MGAVVASRLFFRFSDRGAEPRGGMRCRTRVRGAPCGLAHRGGVLATAMMVNYVGNVVDAEVDPISAAGTGVPAVRK